MKGHGNPHRMIAGEMIESLSFTHWTGLVLFGGTCYGLVPWQVRNSVEEADRGLGVVAVMTLIFAYAVSSAIRTSVDTPLSRFVPGFYSGHIKFGLVLMMSHCLLVGVMCGVSAFGLVYGLMLAAAMMGLMVGFISVFVAQWLVLALSVGLLFLPVIIDGPVPSFLMATVIFMLATIAFTMLVRKHHSEGIRTVSFSQWIGLRALPIDGWIERHTPINDEYRYGIPALSGWLQPTLLAGGLVFCLSVPIFIDDKALSYFLFLGAIAPLLLAGFPIPALLRGGEGLARIWLMSPEPTRKQLIVRLVTVAFLQLLKFTALFTGFLTMLTGWYQPALIVVVIASSVLAISSAMLFNGMVWGLADSPDKLPVQSRMWNKVIMMALALLVLHAFSIFPAMSGDWSFYMVYLPIAAVLAVVMVHRGIRNFERLAWV
ncbi:MAG: hypothetical protein AAF525_00530 [Pseudomonadota bacterium]